MDTLARIRTALEETLSTVADATAQVNAYAIPDDTRQQAYMCWQRIQKRSAIVEPTINEGCWAILLDLYANEDVRPISISSACVASGHSSATALRWIKQLVGVGLIVRLDDTSDARRTNLGLTEKGRGAVLAYVAA